MIIATPRSLGLPFEHSWRLLPAPLFSQGRNYGRSQVITQQGIAATSQTLASQAAVQILARGGTAVDAAIAANAVLAVVEPMKDGLGGDLFALYWDAKTGKLQGLNASGPAPRGLTPEFLAKLGIKTMPQQGIHSFTVPGAVDGWWKMHQRYGKLPWKDLFQSAIAYAEDGFPVSEAIQESWADAANTSRVRANPESMRVFFPGGKAPLEGDVFRNPGNGARFSPGCRARPGRHVQRRNRRCDFENLATAWAAP